MTTTTQTESQGFLSKLGARASNVSAILAVFAVILYAVLRVAYSIFYKPFGLYPDDLGLGYLDLIVQSAVGIVLLLLAMFLVVLLLVTLALVSRRLLAEAKAEAARAQAARAEAARAEAARAEAATAASATAATAATAAGETGIAERGQAGQAEEPPAKAASRFSWVGNALGVVALAIFSIFFYGGLVIFVLHRVFGERVPTVWVVLGDIVAALFVVGMVGLLGQVVKAIVYRLSRLEGGRLREKVVTASGYSARQWRQTTIAVATFVLIVGTVSLLWKASYDRSQVLSGHAAAFTVLGFPITSWRAEDAKVSWTTPNVAKGLKPVARSCVLYLGESGDTDFFYQASTHGRPGRLLRLSTQDVTVRTGPRVC